MSNDSIKDKARAILADRLEQVNQHRKAVEDNQKAYEAKILATFEEVFASVLPLLKAEEISYSAHMRDGRYAHMGTYISFHWHGKLARMDFSVTGDYRYEYTEYMEHGRSCYGKWNMDDFIVWIASEFGMV